MGYEWADCTHRLLTREWQEDGDDDVVVEVEVRVMQLGAATFRSRKK